MQFRYLSIHTNSRISVPIRFVLIFSITVRKEPDRFIVENVTDANIIVAVKMSNGKDGYPSYDTVFYQLNQNDKEKCQLSYKNQTHDICKIVTHRLATRFTLRLRACWRRSVCTDYSNWQTVWTLPPRKRTSQFIKVNCILDIVKPG